MGTRRRLRGAARPIAALLLATVAALVPAAPAAAHGGSAPVPTDYSYRITSVDPATPGLTIRFVEANYRLEVRNGTGRTIDVLGYLGEPYLQLRPNGAYENRHAPSLGARSTTPAPGTSTDTAPDWRRTSTSPVVHWHDHRAHWSAPVPAAVLADPSRAHRVLDWAVPLRDGDHPITVHGTVDWLPPPAPANWWAGILLAAAAIAALAAFPQRPDRREPALIGLGVVAIVGGLGAFAYTAAFAADAADPGPGGLAGALLLQIWPLIGAGGAVAAGVGALTRRPASDFALALGGAILAVLDGLANGAVFSHAVAPVAADGDWAQWTVAGVIACGTGLAAAAILRMRRAGRSAAAPVSGGAQPEPTGAATGDP